MLVNDSAALARLNSPNNLINQLKRDGSRKSAMSLFVRPKEEVKKIVEQVVTVSFNPFKEKTEATVIPLQIPEVVPENQPTINSLLENSEQQIKLATAHDSALEVLTRSVTMLASKLDDVKADRLPSVITATSKVVESIRKERAEATRDNKGREVHYHFYTPTQRKVEQYDVIEVG